MVNLNLLGRGWSSKLESLLKGANQQLLISSPFITNYGVEFVKQGLSKQFCSNGTLYVLANLSPLSICQGSIDPHAIYSLSRHVHTCFVSHLPALHAKVYVADHQRAIVTSANLTAGGLKANYEYGVEISDRKVVKFIYTDILSYSDLGADICEARLLKICSVSDAVHKAFTTQRAGIARSAKRCFDSALREAEDQLVQMKLGDGAMHTVFARTIVYLLGRHGRLQTIMLHPMIQGIHPDLCDDSVDRVIDGKRFGKKWKHAVRTAQQQLKKKGIIRLENGQWKLLRRNAIRT